MSALEKPQSMNVCETLMKMDIIPIMPKSDGDRSLASTIPIRNCTPWRENRSMALQRIPLMICVMLAGPLFFLISKIKNKFLFFLLACSMFQLLIKEFSIGYSLISFSIGAYIAVGKIDVRNIETKKLNIFMSIVCLAYLIYYGSFVETFHNSVFLFSWSLFYLLWIGYDKIPAVHLWKSLKIRKRCSPGLSISLR